MTFDVIDCDQRSDAWFLARAGRLTSSSVAAIFMQGRSKGSESVTKRDLRIRLALERIIGRSLDGDACRSADMQYGADLEPEARMVYEAETGCLVREVGFLASRELLIGSSPDGLIGDGAGGAEFKCPKSSTHLEYIRTPGVPEDYLPQLRHHLLVSGAEWWDFVSYDKRMPEGLQLCIRRLWAKDAQLDAHGLAVRMFCGEVEKEMAAINALRPTVAA